MPGGIVKLLARKDAVIATLFVIAVAVLAYLFDLHERVNHLTERFEEWELDELIVVLFASAMVMAWYSHRRLNESRRLLDVQRNFVRAFEEAGEAIIIMDRHARVEFSNRSYTLMTGYETAELAGNVLPVANEHAEIWARVREGEPYQGMIDIRRKDGTLFPAMLSIAPVYRSAQSEVAHYVLIQQDMQEHQALESQLRQMQKMDALGALVGGVAHDFNNLLSGMVSNAFLAKSSLSASSEATGYIEVIEKLVRSGADTVQQLLTFSRKSRVQMGVLHLNEVMEDLFDLAEKGVRESVRIELHGTDAPIPILADAVQLQQIVLNLVNNANDAVRSAETPEIHLYVDTCPLTPALKQQHTGLTGDELARIVVVDNGCGIGDEHIEHIFEPFFTTKEVGKGSGIGLAMVYGMVRSHNGAIDVDSHPGKGTRFTVYLPLTSRAGNKSAGKTDEAGAEAGEGEVILLADDDTHVRESLKKTLHTLNYGVLTVRNGKELKNAFKAHADEISLVIADVVMPEENGVSAMKELRAVYPARPVIFVSGYDTDQVLEEIENWERCLVHPKPVSVELMSRQIRELISGSRIH